MKISKFIVSGLVMLSSWAWAQKPIELVVPFPPGGVSGNLAHAIAEMLTENGMHTIVINKPGADATIGANYAAAAEPNGKTLFMGAGSSMAANIAFGVPGMKYNEKSFVPVTPMGQVGQVLIVPPNSPFKNYEQFKFYVRKNPEKFFVGFWHNNYSKILYAWAEAEGLPKPTVVVYKGGAAMELAVMSGEILCAVDPWTTPSQLYAGKKINVIAGFTDGVIPQIHAVDPKNPSISIAKQHPEIAFAVWYGVYAPAGTPPETVQKINTIMNKAFLDPKWKEKMSRFYLTNYGGSPEKLIDWQRRDIKNLQKFANETSANALPN